MPGTLLILAQADPKAAEGPSAFSFLPILIVMMLFWLLLLRPASQQARKQQELLASLKPNDEVITSSGIIGVVVSVGKDERANEVILKSDGTRLKVLKSAITTILPPSSGRSASE